MTKFVTDQMKGVARNLQMNSALQAMDEMLQREFPGDPETQMGVLAVAQGLAFRRVRQKNKLTGAKLKFVKDRAVSDVRDKLITLGYQDAPPPESKPVALGSVTVQGG